MKPESNRPITIEDILRLKRAERPPAEFWATFDRELRAKQLAALVGKRPWWQTLPKSFARLTRYRVLLGASAVVAVTFFSVRDAEPTASAPPADVSTSGTTAVVSEAETLIAELSQYVASIEAAPAPAISTSQVEAVAQVAAPAESPSPAPTSINIAPIVVAGAIDENLDSESPAARRIAANLTKVQAEPTAGRNLLAARTSFEDRALPRAVAVEPLQQMTPPSDTRRARLLTAMVSMASMESSMRTTERAANRIAEERLYDDQISRFGARGDRFQVKF
jgi:hypothetical protein